jgi:hypothetical protein
MSTFVNMATNFYFGVLLRFIIDIVAPSLHTTTANNVYLLRCSFEELR